MLQLLVEMLEQHSDTGTATDDGTLKVVMLQLLEVTVSGVRPNKDRRKTN